MLCCTLMKKKRERESEEGERGIDIGKKNLYTFQKKIKIASHGIFLFIHTHTDTALIN